MGPLNSSTMPTRIVGRLSKKTVFRWSGLKATTRSGSSSPDRLGDLGEAARVDALRILFHFHRQERVVRHRAARDHPRHRDAPVVPGFFSRSRSPSLRFPSIARATVVPRRGLFNFVSRPFPSALAYARPGRHAQGRSPPEARVRAAPRVELADPVIFVRGDPAEAPVAVGERRRRRGRPQRPEPRRCRGCGHRPGDGLGSRPRRRRSAPRPRGCRRPRARPPRAPRRRQPRRRRSRGPGPAGHRRGG